MPSVHLLRARAEWPFYVYELTDESGAVVYVGKGCKSRLATQKRHRGLGGHEVARFKKEAHAYAYEIVRIREVGPIQNKHPGGVGGKFGHGGGIFAELAEINRVGTRRFAARLILKHMWKVPGQIGASELERIRAVANGPRC